jgi:hypothetical protein
MNPTEIVMSKVRTYAAAQILPLFAKAVHQSRQIWPHYQSSPILTRSTKKVTKKGTEKGTFLILLFETRYFIQARVAQWIRAFASGAKGRRFDPCRGYQQIFWNHSLDIKTQPFVSLVGHGSDLPCSVIGSGQPN